MASYLTDTEELTSIANAIRTKGGTTAPLEYPDEFVSAINDIETGGSDPYPVRNDGNHHLWVLIDDINSPSITFQMNYNKANQSYINWGDGSDVTYIGSTNRMNLTHTYATTGLFEIVVVPGATGQAYFNNATMMGSGGNARNINEYVNGCKLRAIEFAPIPRSARIGAASNGALWNCGNLQKITYPDMSDTSYYYNVYSYGFQMQDGEFFAPQKLSEINMQGGGIRFQQGFKKCTSLESLDLSNVDINGTTASYAGDEVFEGCIALKNVILPTNLPAIGGAYFENCRQLKSINIPSTVISIGASAFANCYSMREIHFRPTTPPTVADSTAWTNLPTSCKIYVPTGTLTAYQAAANYPDPATYTYVEE